MRRVLLLIFLGLIVVGCQRPPMVLPGMFVSGRIDPLADVPDSEQTNTQTLFYVTDRVYDDTGDNGSQYTRMRSDGLDLGSVEITFGPEDAWGSIVAATRGEPEGKRYRPQLTGLTRLGELDRATIAPPRTTSEGEASQPQASTDAFVAQLNRSLERSSGKAITIYLHGFKTDFRRAALDAAEYDLYTGGLGPFILYSWPSYDSLFEYSHDRDSVRYTTGHARRFVAFLAGEINAGRLDARKIHFVAHSSGAEVVGAILRELALISHDKTPEERRAQWRIGSVLMIAPDISTDVARERLIKEDLRGMFDEIVVYSSIKDRALKWASRILYRTPRIGSIQEIELTQIDRYWLSQADNVALVDSDSLPYGGFVNHSHHRFSPAVASDIILCLRSDLSPPARGLVRDPDQVIWQFPEDYTQRVQKAAERVYGVGNKK